MQATTTEKRKVREGDLERLALLQDRLKGGDVGRYHTMPYLGTQSVADHTWRVMTIIHTLWPHCSKELLITALYHDVAEATIGDMPKTAKWNHPELAQALAKVEKLENERLSLPDGSFLSGKEHLQFKIADMLECAIYCYWQIIQGNLRAREIFSRASAWIKSQVASWEEDSPGDDTFETASFIVTQMTVNLFNELE